MKLKDGSIVNVFGRLDEDTWEDQTTHEKKSAPVIILEDIEYASVGGGNKEGNSQGNGTGNQAASQSAPAPAGSNDGGFTGFEPFGGGSFFDEN